MTDTLIGTLIVLVIVVLGLAIFWIFKSLIIETKPKHKEVNKYEQVKKMVKPKKYVEKVVYIEKHSSHAGLWIFLVILFMLIAIAVVVAFTVPFNVKSSENYNYQVPYTYEASVHGRDCDYTSGCRCTDTHWFFSWCTDCLCSKTGYRTETGTRPITVKRTIAQMQGWTG